MLLIQCVGEGQRLKMFISQCPYGSLVAKNVHNLSSFSFHQHNASYGCLQWITLPKQVTLPLWKKNRNVFYSFRINSEFLYVASKALCVQALDYFCDLIFYCSLCPLYLRHHHFLPFLRHTKLIPTARPWHWFFHLENSQPNIKWLAFSSHQYSAQLLSSQRTLT